MMPPPALSVSSSLSVSFAAEIVAVIVVVVVVMVGDSTVAVVTGVMAAAIVLQYHRNHPHGFLDSARNNPGTGVQGVRNLPHLK